jgi:hypothetical protein
MKTRYFRMVCDRLRMETREMWNRDDDFKSNLIIVSVSVVLFSLALLGYLF